jgi:hypothetical protein
LKGGTLIFSLGRGERAAVRCRTAVHCPLPPSFFLVPRLCLRGSASRAAREEGRSGCAWRVKRMVILDKNPVLKLGADFFRREQEDVATDETQRKHGFLPMFVKSVFNPWLIETFGYGSKPGYISTIRTWKFLAQQAQPDLLLCSRAVQSAFVARRRQFTIFINLTNSYRRGSGLS